MAEKLTRGDVVVRRGGGGYHVYNAGRRLGTVQHCIERGCSRWWDYTRAGKKSAGMWERQADAIQALLDEVNRDV